MANGEAKTGMTSRYLSLFAAMLLLTASITALIVHRVTSLPPGVFVLPPQRWFGTVKDEERVRAKYVIYNNTEHAVTLVKTSVSCGCLQLRLSKNRIAARGRATAELLVDVSRRVGRQTFEALVVTDDKQTPSLVLRLAGTVISSKPLDLPYSLGRFPPGFPVEEQVRLPKGGDPAARIVDATVRGIEGWSAEPQAASDHPDTFLVVVSGKAPSIAGPFQCELHLEAAGAGWKRAKVTLAGSVVSRWRFPGAVYFGEVGQGCTVQRSITITDVAAASGGRPRRRSPQAVSDIAALRTHLTRNADTTYRLLLELSNTGAEQGPFSGMLRLNLPIEGAGRSSDGEEIGTVELHAFFD